MPPPRGLDGRPVADGGASGTLKTRIVFMGTPEFAVPSLRALASAGCDVAAVVTQPDRPSGRGRRVKPSPVKEAAEELRIEVITPGRIRDVEVIERLNGYGADLFIVVAYGKILSKAVLDIPKRGCVNLHASLLPKYRGAAPINWALINGEEMAGATTMRMDEGMDTGDILLTEEIETRGLDAGTLTEALSLLGAKLLVETVDGVVAGTIEPIKQDENEATYAPILKKEDGLIEWSRSAGVVANLVRGVNPWPGAYTYLKGKRIKVHSGTDASASLPMTVVGDALPGTIIDTDTDTDAGEGCGIYVMCGDGVYRIETLQPEGRKSMLAGDFLRGHEMKGERFGEL